MSEPCKDTKKLERAIDRLVQQQRDYYEGWLKAWLKAATRKGDSHAE